MASQETLAQYLSIHRNCQEMLNRTVVAAGNRLDTTLLDTMGLSISHRLNRNAAAIRASEMLVSATIAYMLDDERPEIALEIDDPIANGSFERLAYFRRSAETIGRFAWVLCDTKVTNIDDVDEEVATEQFRTLYDFHLPAHEDLEEVLFLPVDSIQAVAA